MPPFEVVSIQAYADDNAAVWVDDVLVFNVPLSNTWITSSPVTLSPGYRKFVINFVEASSTAILAIEMSINGSAYAPLPMSRVYPVQPGGTTSVALSVNGVAAAPACAAATLSAALPAGYVPDASAVPERTSATTLAGVCGYMYSTIHADNVTLLQQVRPLGCRHSCKGAV